MQRGIQDGECLRPYYHDDENMVERLGSGVFYQESCFAENVSVKELEAPDADVLIERWSDSD